MSLVLRNPHSVLAALQMRPEDVFEVRLAPGTPSPKWADVAELARQHSIPIRTNLAPVDKRHANEGKSERTGAAVALVRERADRLVDELFAVPADPPGLWLALEQLQDPHNVGAIFRTAAFFGVRGIILTRERSAPLTATVYDVSSGGLEFVPFAIVPSLSRTITLARDAGLTVIGTSEHASRELNDLPSDRSHLLIFGNEEFGLRRVTTENVDELVRLAPRGPIESLNVSVAAGVCMSKLARG
ncbi:MAG: RNA methyltransferase [Planctomycetota bacterium]